MSRMKNPASASRTPSYGGRMDLWAQSLGHFCGVLCGLLILATLVTTAWACSSRGARVMEPGFIFLFFIPIVSVPVALLCLVGTIVSIGALRRYSSPEARTGLWFSLGGPIAVVSCYAVCWGIMVASGV